MSVACRLLRMQSNDDDEVDDDKRERVKKKNSSLIPHCITATAHRSSSMLQKGNKKIVQQMLTCKFAFYLSLSLICKLFIRTFYSNFFSNLLSAAFVCKLNSFLYLHTYTNICWFFYFPNTHHKIIK